MKNVGKVNDQFDIVSVKNTALENVRHVSTTGSSTGDGSLARPFDTITNAQNSITDASPTKRYVIKIAPGNYSEGAFTLKPNVFVEGDNVNTTKVTFTTISLDNSWNTNQDHRSGFKRLFLNISSNDNGHNAPYGITFDFNAKESVQGKIYFDNTLIFGTLYAKRISTNEINQMAFRNTQFFKQATFDDIKSIHAGNEYYSTIKGIGSKSIFTVAGLINNDSFILENGATVSTYSVNSTNVSFTSSNNGYIITPGGNDKNNVRDALDELAIQNFDRWFYEQFYRAEALKSRAYTTALQYELNNIYYDNFPIDDEFVTKNNVSYYYYSYNAGSGSGTLTSEAITINQTSNKFILLATTSNASVSFDYSLDGTNWSGASLEVPITFTAGSSTLYVRANLNEKAYIWSWAVLYNN